jgi:undecaprenyl-diphosphatase
VQHLPRVGDRATRCHHITFCIKTPPLRSHPQQKALSVRLRIAVTWPLAVLVNEGERRPMDEAISRRRCSLARLSAVDLYLVHWFVQTARPRPVRSSAIALSWMGNGWIYLALSIGSIIAAGLDAIPVLVAGTANVLALHCIYPIIKRLVARPRPYQRDASLVPLLQALDQHSFPSGHAMTLPAALVPLSMQFPQTMGLAFATCLLMAWARLASAHHYPSDVAVGTVLGFSVSYPISVYALAASRLVS